MEIFYSLFLIYSMFFQLVSGVTTTPLTWVTSNLVRAGNQNVIASLTGNDVTPTHTFTFSAPLSGFPYLGYGIKAYQGHDYIGQEYFQVNRTNLDATSFSVAVQILGTTNIMLLNVPYIAIDPLFPHHINSFDNVPVNYTFGPLVNISTKSSLAVKTFTNFINYTQQAVGSLHNTFGLPLNKNKILLFLTSLFINSDLEQYNLTVLRPVNLSITSAAVSATSYRVRVFLNPQSNITKLHFSMVIFDYTDVLASGTYQLVFKKIDLPYTGGFIPVPVQFVSNFIMGWLDFSTNKSNAIIDFRWNFKIVNGVHGVFMPVSVGNTNFNFGTQTLNRITYTLFYMKTWICPALYFFNPDQDLCTTCPILNCINCYNLTVCNTCNQLNNFFLDSTMQCSLCNLSGCLVCVNLTQCQTCDLASNYSFVNGTCQYCNISQNIFLNGLNLCQACNLSNCLLCSNLSTCQLCDEINGYYLPPLASTCSYCNSSINMFINSLGQCETCNLTGCLACSSLSSCTLCDLSNNYSLQANSTCGYCNNLTNMFINISTSQCQLCSLTGCQVCQNLISCQVCDSGNNYYLPSSGSVCSYCNNSIDMFINSSSNQCQTCLITGCLDCSNLTSCLICDTINQYYIVGSNCVHCSNLGNCTINTTNNNTVTNATNNTSSICGNAVVQPGQLCDDGNLLSYDGCSPLCQTQLLYKCSNVRSFCLSTFVIDQNSFKIQKIGCNKFQIIFKTNTNIQESYFVNSGLNIIKKQVNNDSLRIQVIYNRDIHNQILELFISSSASLLIRVTSGTPLLLYDENQCQTYQNTKIIIEGIKIISYVLLFVSLFSCKIVGLELFGVLQLAYFSLAEHDFQNIYLSFLNSFKIFNGLNLPFFTQQFSLLPPNVQILNVSTSFINNCNIMIIVLFLELLVSFTLLMVSRITKSQKLFLLSKRLFKEGFITIVMFNIFNISFSAGIHWKYSNSHDSGYLFSIIVLYTTLLVSLISVFFMLFLRQEQYGEFRLKFKEDSVSRSYITISMLYRMGLGFFIALKNDYPQSALLILSFSLAFILYNITNLPFTNYIHNYRCNIIHLTQLIILFCANYYRSMKMNTPIQIKGHIHSPALLQLGVIVMCVIISGMATIYEIIMKVKKYLRERKLRDQLSNEHNATLQTISQEAHFV